MRLDPTQLPQLPLAFMNADHAEEARLLDALLAALEAHRQGGPVHPVLERLAVLAVHTREDFLREEQVMREARFPGYLAHKAEHDGALAAMDAEARRFREGGEAERLWRYLQDALPAWYGQHIRTMDVAAARFVAGKPGEERPAAPG